MAELSQRLNLKQGQSLVMTPQLQLSLKLLQFSTQELTEYISSELEKNPLLEIQEPDDNKSENLQESEESRVKKAEEISPSDKETSWDNDSITENAENSENIWNNSGGEDGSGKPIKSPAEEAVGSLRINGSGGTTDFRGNSGYEQSIAREVTLREKIEDQINLDISDPAKKLIALHLIDLLNESGYVSEDFSSIANLLECDISLVEETLLVMQKFDPPGIFARNLSECMELQLRDKNRFDPIMSKLLKNLDLMAKREWKKLSRICKVTEEELFEMCREIRELNPRPASNFILETVQSVQPDIFLRQDPDGTWALELNNDTLPKLLFNRRYYAEVKDKARHPDEKTYLSDQMTSANWLLKTLNQRAETILRVSTELVSQQEDFFEKGIYHLKPLVQNDIAEKLGIHESTVGRVTSNKYISTPRGLYELKFFFSSAIHSSLGAEDYSSKSVKHMIKELIDSENPKEILSDDGISTILKSRGMNIARRTVAKYRESMRIPSSPARRREKCEAF